MLSRKYYVKGMHCPSCEIYIENKLKDIDSISNIKSNYKNQTVTFNTNQQYQENTVINEINNQIEKDGYQIQADSLEIGKSKQNILLPLSISIIIMLIFYLIQKYFPFDIISGSTNIYLTSFLIGVLASLSSCMAVVGSITISMSTKYKNRSSIIIFHISRIFSFFILGGILGLIGSTVSLSDNFYLISGIVLFFIMIIMGLNLLDLFPFVKNLQPKLPKQITSKTFRNNTSPLLLGFLTFFLPCGFTQSMQILAISTGDIIISSLTMLIFALGTLPILGLLSFGIRILKEKVDTQILFKTAGFIIIFFSLYNLMSLLTSIGIIVNIF